MHSHTTMHDHSAATKLQRTAFALVFFARDVTSQVAALTSVGDISRVLGATRIASAMVDPGAEIHVAAHTLLSDDRPVRCVELTSGRTYGIQIAVVTRPIRGGVFGTLNPELIRRVRERVRLWDATMQLARVEPCKDDVLRSVDWRVWSA